MLHSPIRAINAVFFAILCLLGNVACVHTPRPAHEPRATVDVAIVGAGLTGLTLAYELKKAGISAVILEAKPWIGGRVQTVVLPGGETVEAHMEEYWDRSPAVTLIRELGLKWESDVAQSSVRLDGRIYPFQGETKDSYLDGMFSASEKAAMLKWNVDSWKLFEKLRDSFYAGKPLPRELDRLRHVSFAAYIKSLHLPHKVSEWIRVTLETEIATEWENISALDGIDEVRVFLDSPEGYGEECHHVLGGNTLFVQALAGKLGRDQIITSAQVTAVNYGPESADVRYLHEGSRYEELHAKTVVVTVPMHELQRIQFNPPLSPEKQRAIKTTSYGLYIKIHVALDAEATKLWHQGEDDVLVLLSDSPAGTVYDKTEYAEDGSAKTALLTLLISGHFAQEMLGMSADEMREHAIKHLDKLFPGAARLFKYAEIFVYPKAVAYWPVTKGRSRFDALAQELRRPEGSLYIGGDTTESSHSEGAVQAALRMAKQIQSALNTSAPAQTGVAER